MWEEVEQPQADAYGKTDTIGVRARYRATIDGVSPLVRRDSFEREPQCFLGVSLENANFSTAKLTGIVEWISRRFPRCTVLVGDRIHRITLETTRGIAGDEALAAALALGAQFLSDQAPVFERFSKETAFEFITCDSVQKTPAYLAYRDQMQRLFEDDSAFRTSVEAFGRRYHDKHSASVSAEERKRRVDLSSQYFLEEFAVFACLQQRGLGVMVYPGSFSTLAEIAAGAFPEAPEELKAMTVVSLCLRGTR